MTNAQRLALVEKAAQHTAQSPETMARVYKVTVEEARRICAAVRHG